MSETLSAKEQTYIDVIRQLESFFQYYNSQKKLSFTAKLASVASVVKNNIPDFFFVGFYIVEFERDEHGVPSNKEVLEMGPYQSAILATPRIDRGKGVCGTAWDEAKTQVVNNVKACKNYIACDNETQSEIVLPVFDRSPSNPTSDVVRAVFDIDSTILDRFDEVDVKYLEKITSLIYL